MPIKKPASAKRQSKGANADGAFAWASLDEGAVETTSCERTDCDETQDTPQVDLTCAEEEEADERPQPPKSNVWTLVLTRVVSHCRQMTRVG